MINKALVKGNEIVIMAPGNSNSNKIKNDLIWDINIFLSANYRLYSFSLSRTKIDSYICQSIIKIPSRYISINALDEILKKRYEVNDDDLKKYRKIIDPQQKISNDVFKELCCMENLDSEYFAIDGDIYDFVREIKGASVKQVRKNIETKSAIYVSLFGFKEMRIKVNNTNLMDSIIKIVNEHCDA